jgi:hypothetical protein
MDLDFLDDIVPEEPKKNLFKTDPIEASVTLGTSKPAANTGRVESKSPTVS